MAYTKTIWRTGETPLSAGNMNNIEDGVEEALAIVQRIAEIVYPVGCYFETTDADFNPNTAFGGTWLLESEGLVHVSAGSTYRVSNNAKDGGEARHLLTAAESGNQALSGTAASNGAHTHPGNGWTFSVYKGTRENEDVGEISGHNAIISQITKASGGTWGGYASIPSAGAHTHSVSIGARNAAQSHNIMQPYKNVYRWHRTA